MDDAERLLQLTQLHDVLDTPGRNMVEPNDVALDVRHLVRALAAIRLTDRVWSGEASSRSPPRTACAWPRSCSAARRRSPAIR